MTPPALLTTSTQTEMKRLMCATALMTQRSRQTECCQGTLYNGQQPCHRKVRAGADFCHYHRAQMKKALVACMREAETTNMRNQQFASDVMQSVAEQASEQATREQQRRERAIADGEAHAATFQQDNERRRKQFGRARSCARSQSVHAHSDAVKERTRVDRRTRALNTVHPRRPRSTAGDDGGGGGAADESAPVAVPFSPGSVPTDD